MNKTIAGLIGAAGALAAAAPGAAAPVLHASTYAELLRPIPNALATLRAMDQDLPEGQVEQVQLRRVVRALTGHHHHHHHRYYRRRHHHHHHHHHG
jgi:hypothetical protein